MKTELLTPANLEMAWQLIQTGLVLMPFVLPLLVLLLLRGVLWRWKASIAVLGSWILWLTWLFGGYYPVGFARYRERGENPMVGFDDFNDAIESIIGIGLLIPVVIVASVWLFLSVWHYFHSHRTRTEIS